MNDRGSGNGSGGPRPPPATSFSTAADISQYNADKEKEGPFKTGLQLEARITRSFSGSNLTYVDSQTTIPVPHSTTAYNRKPDLLVRTPSGGLHMVDIKTGSDMTKSVDQLKDLTGVQQHNNAPFSSLRVATATGSKNTDVVSLMKVHNHSRAKKGLPVLARTDSMEKDQFVTIPELAARKRQKKESGKAPVAPRTTGPSSAPPGAPPFPGPQSSVSAPPLVVQPGGPVLNSGFLPSHQLVSHTPPSPASSGGHPHSTLNNNSLASTPTSRPAEKRKFGDLSTKPRPGSK